MSKYNFLRANSILLILSHWPRYLPSLWIDNTNPRLQVFGVFYGLKILGGISSWHLQIGCNDDHAGLVDQGWTSLHDSGTGGCWRIVVWWVFLLTPWAEAWNAGLCRHFSRHDSSLRFWFILQEANRSTWTLFPGKYHAAVLTAWSLW